MSAEHFARRVLDDIENHAASVRTGILSGAIKDYPGYTRQAGELRGLDRAAQIVRDALAPMLDSGHPMKEQHFADTRTARGGSAL